MGYFIHCSNIVYHWQEDGLTPYDYSTCDVKRHLFYFHFFISHHGTIATPFGIALVILCTKQGGENVVAQASLMKKKKTIPKGGIPHTLHLAFPVLNCKSSCMHIDPQSSETRTNGILETTNADFRLHSSVPLLRFSKVENATRSYVSCTGIAYLMDRARGLGLLQH
jgi:hypothetical protein